MSKKYKLQILASMSGALTTFTTGQLMGWTSPSVPYLLSENSTVIHGGITNSEASWIASLVMVGNFIGIILAACIVDVFGRKNTILLSTFPVFFSWMILYFARRVVFMYFARLIGGVGETIGKTSIFMYVGEIADAKIRGALGTFIVITINLGILYEYALGPFISYENLALVSSVVPIILFSTFICMPESPYYLLLHDDADKAESSLKLLRDSTDVSTELNEIKSVIEKRLNKLDEMKLLFSIKKNRQTLLLTCILFASQELCGITPTIMYAEKILEEANIGSPMLFPIIFPIAKILATLLTTVLVDNSGRRPLYMVSTICCGLSMTALSIYFFLQDCLTMNMHNLVWLTVVLLTIYNFMFIVGVGTLPFILVGELFPTNIKALAVSITAACSPVSGVFTIKLFQFLRDTYGKYASFGFFAISAYVYFIFAAFYLPETKKKTLAQIVVESDEKTRLLPSAN